MDKATIDAMRAVVGLLGKTVKRADSYGRGIVNTLDGEVRVSTLRAADEGLRTLIDEAAERAEGVTAGRDEDPTRMLLSTLSKAAKLAEKHGDASVRFQLYEGPYFPLYVTTIQAAVRVIEAMLADAPSSPAKPAEPTLEECVEAINRAKHRGQSDWNVHAIASGVGVWLDQDELTGLGRLLIERERDAAKGGAA